MIDHDSEFAREVEGKIIPKDGRFTLEAYAFIVQTLDYLQDKIEKETGGRRHVTGQELSKAVRDYAMDQFGPMSKSVLEHWGLNKTDDIGSIVYNLIKIGLMGKTDDDRMDDFNQVYDFKKEFEDNFRFRVKGLKI